MKHVKGCLMILVCVGLAGVLNAAFVSGHTLTGAVVVALDSAENSEQNLRENDGTTLTPFDQSKGSEEDVEMTRRIRQSLMADNTLSMNAHNIKIVTLNGKATLRGPVDTHDERRRVLKIATLIVGLNNVINLLEVVND
ncbi:MAG: BON domain-containing protein [Nitrospirales bacterium]|nr:BON domain-containing protein [Nitrospirales bacterium]